MKTQKIINLLMTIDNSEDLDVINHVLQRHRSFISKYELITKIQKN